MSESLARDVAFKVMMELQGMKYVYDRQFQAALDKVLGDKIVLTKDEKAQVKIIVKEAYLVVGKDVVK